MSSETEIQEFAFPIVAELAIGNGHIDDWRCGALRALLQFVTGKDLPTNDDVKGAGKACALLVQEQYLGFVDLARIYQEAMQHFGNRESLASFTQAYSALEESLGSQIAIRQQDPASRFELEKAKEEVTAQPAHDVLNIKATLISLANQGLDRAPLDAFHDGLVARFGAQKGDEFFERILGAIQYEAVQYPDIHPNYIFGAMRELPNYVEGAAGGPDSAAVFELLMDNIAKSFVRAGNRTINLPSLS